MLSTNKAATQKIKDHILSYFTGDFGWDNPDSQDNLKEQVNAMRYGNKTDYQIGLDMVDGGSFLIYYGDIAKFLNGLGINPNNREYTDQQVWNKYRSLLAREIAKLVNY